MNADLLFRKAQGRRRGSNNGQQLAPKAKYDRMISTNCVKKLQDGKNERNDGRRAVRPTQKPEGGIGRGFATNRKNGGKMQGPKEKSATGLQRLGDLVFGKKNGDSGIRFN